MKYQEDAEIVETFITETTERLEELEHGVLMMEKGNDYITEALVNRLFRSAHSIKAGANLMEFANIERLAHALEDVLDSLRKDQITYSSEIVSVLLDVIDKISELVDDIHNSESKSVDAILALFNTLTKQGT